MAPSSFCANRRQSPLALYGCLVFEKIPLRDRMLLVTSYFDVKKFQYLGNIIKFHGKFKRESIRFDLEEKKINTLFCYLSIDFENL